MNWIRDNIIKIVIGIFLIIVIIVVVVACGMGGGSGTDKSEGYISLENKLQNAAIKYVNEHPKILPKATGTVKKVTLDTLIAAGKINKLYAADDKSVVCKGYVEIEKISDDSKEYRYTPYISCGKYYVTKTIGDYIIDKETNNGEFTRTSEDGLYEIGDEYVFRGEYPNNFIYIGDHLYRIMKVSSTGELQLVSAVRTYGSYKWDDRYNIEKDRTIGINDFEKSRLNETLEFLYENTDTEQGEVFFTKEKNYIVDYDFCIGKRSVADTNIYSGAECSKIVPLKVGLITISEFARASIDPNCKGIFDKSCANYNFFTTLDNENNYVVATLTAVAENTYEYFAIDYVAELKRADVEKRLFPVFYINDKVIYKSGSGTYLDPYVVR